MSTGGLLDIVIVGGATLLGREVQEALGGSTIPVGNVRLVSTRVGEEQLGIEARLVDFGGEALVETPIVASEIEEADLVFLCEPGAALHPAVGAATRVVDLSRSPGARGIVAVAGVNDGAYAGQRWVRSPHPASVLLCHVMHALAPLSPSGAAATVVLGASDAGRAGVDELMDQTRATLSFSTVPNSVFPRQLAFNVFAPFEPRADGSDVESTIGAEVGAVAGQRVAVALLQASLFYGVAASLHVNVAGDSERALGALADHPAIALWLDDDSSIISVAGEDSVVVGRLRVDADGGLFVWALCDNARRGGALNAVEVASRLLGS